MEEYTRTLRFFGLPRQAVEERLADVLTSADVTADLTARDEDVALCLTASDEALLDTVTEQVAARMNVYLYSRDGKTLAARVVELLQQRGMTVALAESCTGGLTAAALTAVPGCSGVFGTGVVSYSCDCKEKLLRVKKETLKAHGAVSGETAGEMARGVRTVSGARLGVSITGEAGPQPAEDHPVGTVYIALADGRRTWVHKHSLGEGRDRTAIRRAAAGHALDLVRRYLEAYPAVMAGGVSSLPAPESKWGHRLRLPNLFPRRGDSLKKRLLKIAVWVLALLLLVGTVLGGYHAALAPDTNRQLQDDLRGLYWDESTPLSNMAEAAGDYPAGMMPRFRSLYDINPDIGGWIRIPDTVIDYPVMNDREGYYENHSFAGEYSFYGQPYLLSTAQSAAELPETLLICGNNTGDEQMFSALPSYRRIAYLRENALIEMNTLYRAATWQIFAVLAVDEQETAAFDYTATTFADEGAREEYIRQLRARSLFDCSLQVTAEDSLLLLSTNANKEYGRDGARLVIAAVEINDEPNAVTYTANWDALMPYGWTTAAARTTRTTVRQEKQEEDTAGYEEVRQDTDAPQTTTTTVTTTTVTTAETTTTTEETAQTTTTTVPDPEETTTTTLPAEDDAGENSVTDEETETENYADLGN